MDPLLVEARRFDLWFQPPEKANLQKAEDLYLQFVRETPNSPLISYVFYHLGQMYTTRV
jgi:outer membrane protein assembly factor BamD (BamD/ComL family)